jgi:hypothetical protein
MAYAVFVNNKRETEWYPLRIQAVLEAHSKGFVNKNGQDVLKEKED